MSGDATTAFTGPETSVTADSIRRIADEMKQFSGPEKGDFFRFSEPFAFGGMRVVEGPQPRYFQKVKIRDSFEHCTPEFRAEMNAWLDQMFGGEWQEPIKRGEAWICQSIGTVIMRRDDIIKLAGVI